MKQVTLKEKQRDLCFVIPENLITLDKSLQRCASDISSFILSTFIGLKIKTEGWIMTLAHFDKDKNFRKQCIKKKIKPYESILISLENLNKTKYFFLF